MKVLTLAAGLAVASISGCATIPHGKTSYYFPKAKTQISITQTLSCNAAGDKLHQVVTVTPTTVYSSDLSLPPAVFEPHSLTGTFTDTDVGLTFTDDGRLSGLNVTSTGQGGAILKDVVSVAAAVGLSLAAAPGDLYDPQAACKLIANYAGKSKDAKPADPAKKADPATATSSDIPTLTLNYLGNFDYARSDDGTNVDKVTLLVSVNGVGQQSPAQILPDFGSASIFKALVHNIPSLPFTVEIAPSSVRYKAAQWAGISDSDHFVTLNTAADAILIVRGPVGDLQKSDIAWQGDVPVPLTTFPGDFFKLPVPKGPVFGTAKFILALSSYGTIDKLEFSNTGASDAADAANTLAGAFKKQTATQQAADVQGKADLIYQQQRLAVCEADGTKCAGK